MKMLNKIIGGSIAIAAALIFSASTTQAQNFLVNANFDSPAFTPNPITFTSGPYGTSGVGQGWAFGGPASGAQASQSDMFYAPITDNPLSAPYTLLEVQTPADSWNPTVAYQIVNGTAGLSYSFSVSALTDTGITWNGGSGVDLQIQFLNASLGNISTLDGGWGLAPGMNTWTSQTITGIAPAGTVYVSPYIMFMDHGNVVNEEVYFDNASLTVPEPTTLALLGMGLAIPFFIRRKI